MNAKTHPKTFAKIRKAKAAVTIASERSPARVRLRRIADICEVYNEGLISFGKNDIERIYKLAKGRRK